MKALKKALSTILSLTMCLSLTLNSAAANPVVTTSGTERSVTVNDATNAFSKTVRSNNFYINVSADAGVFPDDAKLSAKNITTKKKKEAVKTAVLEELESEGRDASRLNVEVDLFDIAVKDGSYEVQPDCYIGDTVVAITRKKIATDSNYFSGSGIGNIATATNYVDEERSVATATNFVDSTGSETATMVFGVWLEDDSVSLESLESETSAAADGVRFNVDYFSDYYAVVTVDEVSTPETEIKEAPTISISSEEPDANGDIRWTVTVDANCQKSEQWVEGFKVTAQIDNRAFDQPTIHKYIENTFKAEDSSVEYSDFKCEDLSNDGLKDPRYKLSWKFKFDEENKNKIAEFTFTTHVDQIDNILKNNTDGDVELHPAYIRPVRLYSVTDEKEETIVAEADPSGAATVTIKDHKHWIDGTAAYDTDSQCINATVTVHSNGYELKNFRVMQQKFASLGTDFEEPSDFRYYYDGEDITDKTDKPIKYELKYINGSSNVNWSCVIEQIPSGEDHTFKISYKIKLKEDKKNKDDILRISHSGLNLAFNVYFDTINDVAYSTFGPEVDPYVSFDSITGQITLKHVTSQDDAAYSDNGYDRSTHTFKWKVKVNGNYGDYIDYMPLLILDKSCDLKSIQDFKWTDSTGKEVEISSDKIRNRLPYNGLTYYAGDKYSWIKALDDNEKKTLGIDTSKNVYMLNVYYPIGTPDNDEEYKNFANKKALEFTVTTGYIVNDSSEDDMYWASNNFGGHKVPMRVEMYTARNSRIGSRINNKNNLSLAAYADDEAQSQSWVINVASVDQRNDKGEKSGYNYTDGTVTYEIAYNQNQMTLNNIAITFDLGRCDVDGQEKIKAPVLEAVPDEYDVLIDGNKIQYCEKYLGYDYRPCYTYDKEKGLTFYPLDDKAGVNAKEHKITFTVRAADKEMLTNAAYNNRTNEIICTAAIKADQIKSAKAQYYAIEYTRDYITASSLSINCTVKGVVHENATIDYEALVNKSQLIIPDGLMLKLNLSSGQSIKDGSLHLYECTLSKDGKTAENRKEIASSAYEESCTKNDDGTSLITVSLPKNSERTVYVVAFTCYADPDGKSVPVTGKLHVKCQGQYEGSDAWKDISATAEANINFYDEDIAWPEGWRDGYWYTIRAVDTDTDEGIEGIRFVVKDKDGKVVKATGVNAEVNDNNEVITPATGFATFFVSLDKNKKYYVSQVSEDDDYIAENTDSVELEINNPGPWQTFKSYTFKQAKASWLTFTQDFKCLNGVSEADIADAAKAISYEIEDSDGKKQTVKFGKLTKNSETGLYTSAPVKLKADTVNNKLFAITQSGGDIAGYNYRLDTEKNDVEGRRKDSDTSGIAVYFRLNKNGSEATAAFTNTYDSALELRFYPDGVIPDIDAMKAAVSIKVINQKTKEDNTYSLKDFTRSGSYFYKKVPAKQGQYTITETNSKIGGYSVQVEYNFGGNEYNTGDTATNVSVPNGRISKTNGAKLVAFKNIYTSDDDKLSLSASGISSNSAKLTGSATKDLTAVYYTRLDKYKNYTPEQLKKACEAQINQGADGIYMKEVQSTKSFTIDAGGLSQNTTYTFYAAGVCKDGGMIGEGVGELAQVRFTTESRTLDVYDFEVTDVSQSYTGDDGKHTAAVKPMVMSEDDETKGKYFDVDSIVYKKKNASGQYIGSYTNEVSQAGTYGIFVTTKNEKDGISHADKLLVGELNISKGDINKNWFEISSERKYGNDTDIAKLLTDKVSKYGDISVKLYTDASLTVEAERNQDTGYYKVGEYYLGAECTGGDNVNKTAKPVSLGTVKIVKGDYQIYLGAAKVWHFGEDTRILSFKTDTGITEQDTEKYEYVFSRTIDGEYTDEPDGTGEWYIKIKVYGDDNHEDTLSAPKYVTLAKAKLKVHVKYVNGKAWDGTKDIADGDWELWFERSDPSIPNDEWFKDHIDNGLSVSGKAAWTSPDAGTSTFDITDLKIVNTDSYNDNDYSVWYELETDSLKDQTYVDDQTHVEAMISGAELTADDFKVTVKDNLKYVNDNTGYTATVEKNEAGEYKDKFEIDYVTYKLKNTENNTYSGSYSAVTQAGTYGIFVTTKDEKDDIIGAEELYLGDMTVGKAKFDESWVKYIVPSYGSEPADDRGFVSIDSKYSGYGDVEVKLYQNKDGVLTEAVRSGDKNQYPAGKYYVYVTIPGGDNIEDPVEYKAHEIVISKAYNIVTLGRPRTLFYGDDLTSCVDYAAKDKTGEVEYYFGKDRDNKNSFKTWTEIEAEDTAARAAGKAGVITAGTWYVYVKVNESDNYYAASSNIVAFELKKAPLVPVLSSLDSKTYDGNTTATGTVDFEKLTSSAATYGKLEDDKAAGLAIAKADISWTDSKAGTDTVNVSNITISDKFADRYALTTTELKGVSFKDNGGNIAKIVGENKLTAADFTVTGELNRDYVGNYTDYTVTVKANPAGKYAGKFNIDKVRYVKLDSAGNATDEFTEDPTDAGKYAILVTTKDEGDGLERAIDLELDDVLVIKQASELNRDWVLRKDRTYGDDAVFAEADFIIRDYGEFTAELYTKYDAKDASKCELAAKDSAGHYPAGAYTLVVSVTGGNNIAASSQTFDYCIKKADNVVTIGTPKAVMYYGDDVSQVVKAYAKDSTDTAELVFARSPKGEFAPWDDTDTNPSGIWYVKARIAGNNNYNAAESKTVAFKLKKALLAPAISGLESKDYDGTVAAKGTLSLNKAGTAASYGKLEADLTNGLKAEGTFEWTSAEADTDTVNVTGIKLSDEYSGRYELTVDHLDDLSFGDAKINKKEEPTTAPEQETTTAPEQETTTAPEQETTTAPEPETKPAPEPETKPAPEPETKPAPEPETTPVPTHETTHSSSGGSSVRNRDRSAVSTETGHWIKDSKGWQYQLSDGSLVKGSSSVNAQGTRTESVRWYSVKGKSYAFGEDGYLQSGWVYNAADGKWYYCDENNGLQTGWHHDESDGYWYYLDAKTGAMLTGWQLINGRWYYFAGLPGTATWSFDASKDKWVYDNVTNVRPYGSLYTNAKTPDNFLVNLDGVWVK